MDPFAAQPTFARPSWEYPLTKAEVRERLLLINEKDTGLLEWYVDGLCDEVKSLRYRRFTTRYRRRSAVRRTQSTFAEDASKPLKRQHSKARKRSPCPPSRCSSGGARRWSRESAADFDSVAAGSVVVQNGDCSSPRLLASQSFAPALPSLPSMDAPWPAQRREAQEAVLVEAAKAGADADILAAVAAALSCIGAGTDGTLCASASARGARARGPKAACSSAAVAVTASAIGRVTGAAVAAAVGAVAAESGSMQARLAEATREQDQLRAALQDSRKEMEALQAQSRRRGERLRRLHQRVDGVSSASSPTISTCAGDIDVGADGSLAPCEAGVHSERRTSEVSLAQRKYSISSTANVRSDGCGTTHYEESASLADTVRALRREVEDKDATIAALRWQTQLISVRDTIGKSLKGTEDVENRCQALRGCVARFVAGAD